jgi:hypothetical protein
MWSAVNAFMNAAIGGWLWPFQRFSTVVQLCALALPVAVLALVAYRYASNQRAIHSVKNRLKAYLLELRLFQDDLAVTMRAQGQILKNSVIYTAHALVPMSLVIIPVALILVQVESRFAYRALAPGESTILEATLDVPAPVSRIDAVLIVPPGVAAETPALRIDGDQKILWRLRAQRPGRYEIRVRIGETEYPKQLLVGIPGQLSPAVHAADDFHTLAFPFEPALEPGSPVSALEVTYPRARGTFAGLSSASWILFAATLVFGYGLRGLFGVTF